MDEKNSEDFINQRFEDQYRSAGFDEESIRTAIRDLKDGMDKDLVDCYMMLSLSPKHRSEMANLFRQGMPLDIGRRLRRMNEDQLNEVFTYASERIPFDAIREVVMHNSSPHQIKKAFELYKEYTKDFAGKVSIKKPTTNVDNRKIEDSPKKEKTEPTSPDAENEIQEDTSEPDIKEDENAAELTDSTGVVEQTEVKEQSSVPDSKELIKEIHQVFADSTNALIENINEKNAGIYADMISRFDDGIQAIVDEIRKDMRANHSIQTPKVSDVTVVDNDEDSSSKIATTPTPQVSSEPAAIRQQAASPTRPSYLEDAVSYTRMILMPDGSLRPIEVERENPKKPKGLLGLASKIFGKDTPQESLLRQLINGRLSGPQLKQILRAVKAAFSPLEIKDLIESDLEPEEMGNIIDVILADRGQILEVV